MDPLDVDLKRVEKERVSGHAVLRCHPRKPLCSWRDSDGIHVAEEHGSSSNTVVLAEFQRHQLPPLTADQLPNHPMCWCSYGPAVLVSSDASGTHILRHVNSGTGSHHDFEGVRLLEEDAVMRGYLRIKDGLFRNTAYFILEGGVLRRYNNEAEVAGPPWGELRVVNIDVTRRADGLLIESRNCDTSWEISSDESAYMSLWATRLQQSLAYHSRVDVQTVSPTEIEKAFRITDVKASGHIDKEELDLILQRLGVTISEAELQEAFDFFDQAGDGLIHKTEFLQWASGEGRSDRMMPRRDWRDLTSALT